MKKQSVFVVGAGEHRLTMFFSCSSTILNRRSVHCSGVVGLSTAIRVLEAGYDVTLFAEVFPTDPKTVKYTSFWAGAICSPGLGDSLSSRASFTLHLTLLP
jgi:hypothetical protein